MDGRYAGSVRRATVTLITQGNATIVIHARTMNQARFAMAMTETSSVSSSTKIEFLASSTEAMLAINLAQGEEAMAFVQRNLGVSPGQIDKVSDGR